MPRRTFAGAGARGRGGAGRGAGRALDTKVTGQLARPGQHGVYDVGRDRSEGLAATPRPPHLVRPCRRHAHHWCAGLLERSACRSTRRDRSRSTTATATRHPARPASSASPNRPRERERRVRGGSVRVKKQSRVSRSIAALAESLAALGFSKVRGRKAWWRQLEDVAQMVYLQRSLYGEVYYMELCVHFGARISRMPLAHDCDIRIRVASAFRSGEKLEAAFSADERQAVDVRKAVVHDVARFFRVNSSVSRIAERWRRGHLVSAATSPRARRRMRQLGGTRRTE